MAISISDARAGASTSKLPSYHYIALLAGKPTNKFFMPVLFLNIINKVAHASGNSLDM